MHSYFIVSFDQKVFISEIELDIELHGFILTS